MSGIRDRNTKPERAVRSALHGRGFRFRLHAAGVPGKPDLVLPAWNAVIFVHGCFWHGHDCRFFRLPQTRSQFWQAKIDRNRERDIKVRALLAESGWRQLVIWECALRGQGADAAERVADRAARWLRSRRRNMEIRGP